MISRSFFPRWAVALLLGGLLGCGDDDDTALKHMDAGKPEPQIKDGGFKPPPKKDAGHDDVVEPDGRDASTQKPPSKPRKKDAGHDTDVPVDAGKTPTEIEFGGLVVDTTPKNQDLDLFGEPGHRFWLEVDKAQLDRLNAGGGYGGGNGDIYTPVVSGAFADHVVVQDAKTGSVADYGKMEVKLVGESTRRQWDASQIPNIHIDTDEFQKKARIGGYEHFRLNNSLVGSIFREQIAHHVFRALGYPALRASYAFLGSNVWGEGTWVPMTLIEMYKLRFCDDNEALLGGTCTNMWEFAGDIANGGGGGGGPIPGPFPGGGPIVDDIGGNADVPPAQLPANACQIKKCDNTRLDQLANALNTTPRGPGFMDALEPYIDWDKFHQFQCLDWMLWVGDDPLHNSNNNLIIERDDGRMVWAPYSIDISAGQEWYVNTPLVGQNSVSMGCQSDPECWAGTIAACEVLIKKFDKLNPEKFVDQTVKTLTDLEMMRDGDDQRAVQLRAWYVQRQRDLPDELERFRYIPDVHGVCPNDLQACNDGGCGTAEQCATRICYSGQQWCEAYQSCYSPQYDNCPVCDNAQTPFYCQNSGLCVASSAECVPNCGQYEYCPSYGGCVQPGTCSDDDGGVEFDGGVWDGGGTGGIGGGMAGFMMAEPPILKMN